MSLQIIQGILIFFGLFLLFVILREQLFFGFAPFLPSRPEVMQQIIDQIKIGDDFTVVSLVHGRSGFMHAIEKKYPNATLIAVENSSFGFLMHSLQAALRFSRIKIINKPYYHVDISKANLVYCFLDMENLREIYKKLRVEPPPGAIIISSGFIVPYFEPYKILKTKPRKRWFSFLIGGQEKILTEKEKEYKPDENIYFYEV